MAMIPLIPKAVPLLIGLLLTTLSSLYQSGNSLTGNWQDEEKPDKQIEMYEQSSGVFYGRKRADNREKMEKERIVFKHLVWNETAKTYTGTLVNPDDSGEYTVVVKLLNANRFEFTVKKFFIRKTFHFVRIR